MGGRLAGKQGMPGGVAHLKMAGSSTMDGGVPASGGLVRDETFFSDGDGRQRLAGRKQFWSCHIVSRSKIVLLFPICIGSMA